jgi:hypothetical protein
VAPHCQRQAGPPVNLVLLMGPRAPPDSFTIRGGVAAHGAPSIGVRRNQANCLNPLNESRRDRKQDRRPGATST